MGNCGCLKRNDKEFDDLDDQPIDQTPVQENPDQQKPIIQMSSHSVPLRQKIKETVNLKKSQTIEGEKKLNDYILKQVLGQGTFGKVRLAEKNLQNYAIKILNKSRLKKQREYYTDSNGVVKIKNAFQNVGKEIAIMKKLRHPNIIRLYEIIDSPNSNKMYMVMEYAQNGQLIDWNEDLGQFVITNKDYKITEDNLRIICRDIIKGIYQMHELGIVHRDLKPQNILFDQKFRAKICDFGVSQIINGDTEHFGTNGTYLFMAPECFENGQFDRKAADIWSFGITIYSFAFLQVPFKGFEIQEIMDSIQQNEIEFPNCRIEFQNFLQKCLNKDPNTRATIKELARDPWLNEGQKIRLLDEIEQKFINIQVDEAEIQEAYSLATFILIKNWVAKLKHQ
ncbi:unnamed protein product [Paramecium pentaurelia]|uniref:Protein kinase domain-containing protein n=1 Tax=Paramecium pentaurelia TaxID=43138 RepID=A0A8S1TDY9_9CILI|nr:unnamed protein product [Paramecium pentaurelia]